MSSNSKKKLEVTVDFDGNSPETIAANDVLLEEDNDEEEYLTHIVIGVWSKQRSSYSFRKNFSEALDVLSRHGFVVKLRELNVLTKTDLMGVHLLWLQGGDRRTLRESEQKVLMEHLLRGGTLLAEVFYPPDTYPGTDDGKIARKIRRTTDSLLSLFGLCGLKSRQAPDRDDLELNARTSERFSFRNRLETYFCLKPEESRPPFQIGPFVPLFEQWNNGEENYGSFQEYGMRCGFLSRGTFGLGQVLLISNTHAFANKNAWLGGHLRHNYHILVNLASSAAEPPPLSPEICRPHVKMATLSGNFSSLIKTFKKNYLLDPDLEQMIMADFEDDEDHNEELGYDTAFHCAAAADNVPMLQFFVEEQQVPVEFQQHDMETAIHAAAREGALRALKYLVIEAGGSLYVPNRRGHLPIHVCARSPRTDNLEQRFEVMRWMVEDMKIDPNITSTVNLSTPFFSSVAPNRPPIAMIHFLKDELNVDTNALNKDNWHPFLVACNNNIEADIVKLFIKWGIDPLEIRLERDKQNGLHRAILNGREKVAKYLAQKYPSLLEEQDINDYTCLHFACRGGHLSIVKWLLTEHNNVIDPKLSDKHQKTGLHVAAIHNRVEVVEYLVENHPDLIELRAKDDWTALTFAARAGAVDAVRILSKAAKLNPITDGSHIDTPLTIAARYSQWGVVLVLLEQKDINLLHVDEDKHNIYQFAVEKNAPINVMRKLFELGFPSWDGLYKKEDENFNILTSKQLKKTQKKGITELYGQGKTPLTYASEVGNRDLVNYFLLMGAGGRFGTSNKRKGNKTSRRMSDAAIEYAKQHPFEEKDETKKKKRRERTRKSSTNDISVTENSYSEFGRTKSLKRVQSLKSGKSSTFGSSSRF